MIKMHLCRQLASELELRLGDAHLIGLLIAAWLPVLRRVEQDKWYISDADA